MKIRVTKITAEGEIVDDYIDGSVDELYPVDELIEEVIKEIESLGKGDSLIVTTERK